MASLFRSFRSSTMPKRLLRYALSRLELLDMDGLDMENLDFALGRNTVLEFRDVGLKLKKLETLLQLPPTFRLEKAKVLVLRITIPVDFYTSPITAIIDGVDICLKLVDQRERPKATSTSRSHPVENPLPHTVDLAQSFLAAQPESERHELEEALAAENQDLGASVTVSEDGSDEEEITGTGQALSLPAFMADFLQGIADRLQVTIRAVKCQLDVDLPLEPNSTTPESVSLQLTMDEVSVEGVTTPGDNVQQVPSVQPRKGKRHIALSNFSALLVSEASVFSSLARSPSVTSPSLASSPLLTRNLPSRETSSLSQGSFSHQPMLDLQESLRSGLSIHEEPESPTRVMADSELALSIPYDMSDPEEEEADASPPTPRAAKQQASPIEASMFQSATLPDDETEQLSLRSQNLEAPYTARVLPISSSSTRLAEGDRSEPSDSLAESRREDLTESHLYTHEDAESMYMSAFSEANSRIHPKPDILTENEEEQPALLDSKFASTSAVLDETLLKEAVSADTSTHPAPDEPKSLPSSMPGGWDDDAGEEVVTAHHDALRDAPSHAAVDVHRGEHLTPDEGHIGFGTEITVEEPEPQTGSTSEVERTSTPKGPTRMVKELLTLKTLSLHVPSRHSHIRVEPSEDLNTQVSQYLGRSTLPQAPGAFSVHASSDFSQKPQSTSLHPAAFHAQADQKVEVNLSPVTVNFDASLGLLLATLAGRILDALRVDNAPTTTEPTGPSEASMELEVKLVLEEVSINFLSQLGGVAEAAAGQYPDPESFISNPVVLLNSTLKNLSISRKPTEISVPAIGRGQKHMQKGISTTVELEKFRFGYANGDILSFDSERPMGTSVRDTFLASGFDIGVKMVEAAGRTRTDVETRPLVLQIDMQRLDETFGWFGGLSNFLNMSSSMTSTAPPIVKSVRLPTQKPRGVHFDTPINPDDKSAAAENKLNLRIGGTLVELVGKDCSVAAESSAVKVVSRDSGIGVSCTMLRVTGPYLRQSTAEPSVKVEVGVVRLDFLSVPKDSDLERLLELITPSKTKFDVEKDEIILDTLLRQRRKGSVLRASVETVNVRVQNMAQFHVLPGFGEEMTKLFTIAKYLPEDDRPGLLTLAKVQKLSLNVDVAGKVGRIFSEINEVDVGHITVPSLLALAVQGVSLVRNDSEKLLYSAARSAQDLSTPNPVVMARMIGDEIEPVVKINLQDVSVEYRVPFIVDLLGLAEDATPQDFEAGLAASIVDLGEQTHAALAGHSSPSTAPGQKREAKPTTLDIGLRDCVLGLNPLNSPSKLAMVLTDAHVDVVLPQDIQMKTTLALNKASLLLVDNVASLSEEPSSSSARRRSSGNASRQVANMCRQGFVDISYISSAKITANVVAGANEGDKQVLVEVRDDLFVLETCADSTQTLISLANALKPPTPASKENKYRTKVMPVQDLLASISAEAFGRPEGEYDFDTDFAGAQEMAGSDYDMAIANESPLRVESQYYDEYSAGEEMFDATKASLQSSQQSSSNHSQVEESPGKSTSVVRLGSQSQSISGSDDLVIHDDFYAAGVKHKTDLKAKVWNSHGCSYDEAPRDMVEHSSLQVSVREVHLIWNLFDGYDWQATRDTISKAVHEVEAQVLERQTRLTGQQPQRYEEEFEEEEEAIGDFLFNSIYIGISANRDPHELSRAINEGLNDNATETESVATTTQTGTTNRTIRPHSSRSKGLRLHRSKHHKITFELKGVNVDLIGYQPGRDETQSSIDVRVDHLDIFDHVPTSTWKKFATYDQDRGERELGTSMVHLEILTVKPNPGLGASEFVLRATLLPLRLHVDQDALDFITRFFEFKDERVPVHASTSDIPFLQRAEVNDVPVKLDFKPKRVDYAGLRSGHTTEFMNFIVLEEARMVLRHVIIYGVSGFDRLGKTLNDIWMPDVRNNQLPGVVAGLAPVRSLVNIGSGFRDLVEIPLREYKKDGRVVRSISKGAAAFARTTGTELVKLGAKLAVGTQYALQGAEGMLADKPAADMYTGWSGDDDDDDARVEEKKQISIYADQPTGVIQGIQGGYRSLARDVNLAKDAIIAVPGEVMESSGPGGVARAVWKRAPTIVFRPAMGVTKVIGQTLMGATNAIDPQNRRRINEKYKH